MPETVAKTNSMAEALKRGEPTTVAVLPTLAEGTAVSKSGKITYPIVRDLLDRLITVSEADMATALTLLLMKDKVLAEGAAALLSGKLDVKGKSVVIVVSGGNIDRAELQQLLFTSWPSCKKLNPPPPSRVKRRHSKSSIHGSMRV